MPLEFLFHRQHGGLGHVKRLRSSQSSTRTIPQESGERGGSSSPAWSRSWRSWSPGACSPRAAAPAPGCCPRAGSGPRASWGARWHPHSAGWFLDWQKERQLPHMVEDWGQGFTYVVYVVARCLEAKWQNGQNFRVKSEWPGFQADSTTRSCVASGRIHRLSLPQLPHLSSGD